MHYSNQLMYIHYLFKSTLIRGRNLYEAWFCIGLKYDKFLAFFEIQPKAFCYCLLNFPACPVCFRGLHQTSLYFWKSLVSGWIACVCDSISSFFSCCKLTLYIYLNVCAVGVCDRPVFLLLPHTGRFCRLMYFECCWLFVYLKSRVELHHCKSSSCTCLASYSHSWRINIHISTRFSA